MLPSDESVDRIHSATFLVPLPSMSLRQQRDLVRGIAGVFADGARNGVDRETALGCAQRGFETSFRKTIEAIPLNDREHETLRAILARLESALCDEFFPPEDGRRKNEDGRKRD